MQIDSEREKPAVSERDDEQKIRQNNYKCNYVKH